MNSGRYSSCHYHGYCVSFLLWVCDGSFSNIRSPLFFIYLSPRVVCYLSRYYHTFLFLLLESVFRPPFHPSFRLVLSLINNLWMVPTQLTYTYTKNWSSEWRPWLHSRVLQTDRGSFLVVVVKFHRIRCVGMFYLSIHPHLSQSSVINCIDPSCINRNE